MNLSPESEASHMVRIEILLQISIRVEQNATKFTRLRAS